MNDNDASLTRYYRLHARVYDATRWSFLFGRERLIALTALVHQPQRILEIGCGTGHNIQALCRAFPDAEITGIDLSAAMLEKAWSKLRGHAGRVRLINAAYDRAIHGLAPQFDLIVCSYSLSMFNPGWDRAIECAAQDLASGGIFSLVDFHDTRLPAFRRWMQCNHVRMDGHLLPAVTQKFKPVIQRVSSAYGGLWRYVTVVGRPRCDVLS